MTIPPLSAIASSQSRANLSLGLIPVENTIKSTSNELPSANCITLPSDVSIISRVFLLVCTLTPISSILRRNCSPPNASSCSAISTGANSITCVSIPKFLTAPAASSPNNPPPTTAPFRL